LRTCLILLLSSTVLLFAEPPVFSTVTLLQDENGTIDIGNYSDPWAGDWNGDGMKDLIVGAFSYNTADYGRMRVYENKGTHADPVFTSFYYMQADGSDIIASAG
jgi:hypothetical protein